MRCRRRPAEGWRIVSVAVIASRESVCRLGYGIEDHDIEFFLGKSRAIKSLIYIFCLILLSGMQP
jgi:hypothetical protein